MNGGETLFDSEWLLLADLFQVQWRDSLSDVIAILSCDMAGDGDVRTSDVTVVEERSEAVEDWLSGRSDVMEVMEANEKWLTETVSSIENEDRNIIEQVTKPYCNVFS